MNQILYTGSTKKGGPLEIKTVLKIFSITCIIFGCILVGKASFAMLTQEKVDTSSVPLVEISQEGNVLMLNIKHDKIIDKIVYSWNQNQEIILQGKGRTQVEEIIQMPEGINTLILKVVDIEGKTVSYNKDYELEEGDVIKPEIELLVEGAKVKIVAKDETALAHIIYYWNDEDETKVNVREDSPKQIEEKIDILKGENTLTIIAVDENGNEEVKEQIFKGVKKPVIQLLKQGNELIVKVTDEEGIQKVEYTLNGAYYSTDANNTGEPLNMKELEFRKQLSNGQNKIIITAYNISGLKEEVFGETTI